MVLNTNLLFLQINAKNKFEEQIIILRICSVTWHTLQSYVLIFLILVITLLVIFFLHQQQIIIKSKFSSHTSIRSVGVCQKINNNHGHHKIYKHFVYLYNGWSNNNSTSLKSYKIDLITFNKWNYTKHREHYFSFTDLHI